MRAHQKDSRRHKMALVDANRSQRQQHFRRRPRYVKVQILYEKLYCLFLTSNEKNFDENLLKIEPNPKKHNSSDRVFAWIDLELSNKPWKTLRSHTAAVRALAYHKRLPLLATVSDDATAIVYHARCPQVCKTERALQNLHTIFVVCLGFHTRKRACARQASLRPQKPARGAAQRQGASRNARRRLSSDAAVASHRRRRRHNRRFHLLTSAQFLADRRCYRIFLFCFLLKKILFFTSANWRRRFSAGWKWRNLIER